MERPKILIIVPAYNESGNIQKTIQEIFSLQRALDILVVNDGSTDTTQGEARLTAAAVISLPFNLGVGGAVQTGFHYAQLYHYDIAVQVDGDGQHDVNFLEKLLEPLLKEEADMVIGSRFRKPYVGYQSSFVRRIGINFFAQLLSFLTGCTITDPTSGFRAYNREAIKIFAQHYPHDFPEPEAIAVALRADLRITEVPVQMRRRAAGHSSIRYCMTLYYMIKVTLAIIMDMLRKKIVE